MSRSLEQDTTDGRRRKRVRDPLVGTVLDDRFFIEERIATGGFGAIYRARMTGGEGEKVDEKEGEKVDEKEGEKIVALKILHPRLTSDPNMVARFRREGATMTKLHDPHTVTTLAVGETRDGTLYIAMELLTGESLHDRLQRDGAMPWQAAVAITRAVCSSLAEAHALGVVHRDLKPENIHVEARGDSPDLVKVIDFGIVKIERGSSIDDGKELTHAGHMIGTYDYMSPEQIVGSPCRDLSDIYSLGIVTYEMLTGRRPFPQVTGPASMMAALLTMTPVAPSVHAAIPPELDRIVMRCLEREPQDRFGDILELAAALDRLMARRHPQHDEVTVARPAYDPGEDPGATIVDDERTWIDLESTAIRDAERSSATSASERPWAMPIADAFATTDVARPRRRIATGTGPVTTRPPAVPMPRAIAEVLYAPPAGLYTTLPGIAVAPRPRHAHDAHPTMPCLAPAAPPVPLGWQPVLPARAWMPTPSIPPSIPCTPLASGSGPQLPARSYRVLWVALVLACIAVVAVVAVV